METIQGFDIARETKKDIVFVRMTKTMVNKLRMIRSKTGVPISKIVRESVRKTLTEVDEIDTLNIKI